MKRTLSLLLALTMVLSLGLPAYAVGAPAEDAVVIADEEPVELPAEEPVEEPIEEPVEKPVTLPIGAGKKIGFTEEEEIVSEDPIVDIVSEESVVEEEAAPAKDFSYSESATGFSVEVSAPAGALPLGTEMVVDRLVDLSSVQNAVDRAENLNGSVQLAADISFWLNGEEIEPAEGTKLFVRMSAPEIEGIAEPIVIHVPDGENAVPEIVEQMSAGDIAMADAVSFEASSFSVYAIIDPEDDGPVRATYYFQNADGSQYFFKNTAGQDVDNQIVKDGEYLEDVGAPAIAGNQTFLGWFVYENNEYGEQIKFGAENPISITAEEDYDVIVRAKYENVLYATFFKEADGGVVLDRQQIVTDENGKGYVDIKNMTATAPLSTQAFVGWATTPNATEEIKDSELTDGKYEITADTDFYPVFKDAHWIRFWASERGAGATYTGPAFVLAEHQAIEGKPEKNPTWSGYVFKYWSETKPEYDDEGHVTNGAEEFNWNQELTKDITLYAVWEYAVAKYTVMFYQQVATDDAGLEDSAKHYEYSHSETRETVKGSTVEPSNADKTAPEGFVFNENKSTASAIAEANGTTVLEVYYDRIAYTLVFVVEGSSYQDYVLANDNNGTQYAYVDGEYKELTRKSETNTEYYLGRYQYYDDEYTGTVYDSSGNVVQPPYDHSQTYYRDNRQRNQLYWKTRSETTYTWELDGEEYTGARYKYQNTSTHIVKRVEALYGHSVKDEFPIVGEDGTSYEGWAWTDSGNPKVYNYVLQTIETMPAANVTFVGSRGSAVKTIYYYVEVVKGEDLTGVTTREFNNKTYKLYKTVTHNFNFLTYDEEYHPITGFERDRSHAQPAFGDPRYVPDGYSWTTRTDENIAPIPNYASYTSYGTLYVYHHNNGSNFTQVSSSQYGLYANEWVNYLYYDRISYKLEFKDSLTNENLSQYETGSPEFNPVKTVQFEESLASYEPDAAVRPLSTIPGKEFAGWFEDPECQTPFDFSSTMPNHDHVVYAGWKDVYYLVKVDPNGGQLDPSESTFFWLTYGKTVSEYGGIKREFVEVDDGTGTYKYTNNTYDKLHADLVAGTYSESLEPMTEEEATAYIWDHYKEVDRSAIYEEDSTGTYKPEANAYALIGWYNVNPDGSLGTPYDFDNEVNADVSIRAMWRRLGDFGVVYDFGAVDRDGNKLYYKDTEGNPTTEQVQAATVPGDSNRYADQSDSSMFEKAGSPAADKYVFVGWYYDGKIYNPGDVYIINAKLADESKNIHIQPVFDEMETVPVRVTHIDWYANTIDIAGNELDEDTLTKPDDAIQKRDGEGWYVEDENLQINKGYDIRPADTYSYGSYEFLGWAKTADATEDQIFLKYNKDDGFFYAEKEEGNGVWDVKVSQVAADENQPYDDLYAIWGGDFKVVYTGQPNAMSDDNIQVYHLSRAFQSFNLLVKHDTRAGEEESAIHSGYLYGGYYTAAPTTSTEAYDGSNWTFAEPQTQDGAAIKPVPGTTYYVKEVPGNVGILDNPKFKDYLAPKISYTYYYKNNQKEFDKIGSVFLVSMIDDAVGTAYKETGFIIDGTRYKADTIKNLTIEALDDSANPKANIEYSASGTNGLISYLLVFDRPDRNGEPDTEKTILKNNQSVQQYWITNDGYLVVGYTTRVYTNLDASGSKPNTMIASSETKYTDPVLATP